MQIWAESGKSALPICNYSQILYQFLTFTQNLKWSQNESNGEHQTDLYRNTGYFLAGVKCVVSAARLNCNHL